MQTQFQTSWDMVGVLGMWTAYYHWKWATATKFLLISPSAAHHTTQRSCFLSVRLSTSHLSTTCDESTFQRGFEEHCVLQAKEDKAHPDFYESSKALVQGSWWPMVLKTCTSVIVLWMLRRFWNNTLPRRPCLFQHDNTTPHTVCLKPCQARKGQKHTFKTFSVRVKRRCNTV